MKNRSYYIFAKVFLFLLIPLYSATAQEITIIKDSIYSEILKENRPIQVVMPKNHQAGSNDKYDVLYLVDGEWHTTMASLVQRYVEQFEFMPPSIIVGISNTNRNRDLLPEKLKDDTTTTGADNFLSFIKSELMPYINKNYPTNGDNTLFGASFGGIFSTYAFLQEPGLFESYIASDPSFWWGNGFMQNLAAEKLVSLSETRKTIYFGGREGEAFKQMGIVSMDSVFQFKAPKSLKWKSYAYPNETHNSVNFKTMYDGMKFSYAGYTPKQLVFHPMNGVLLKGKPIKIWYFNEISNIRYTIDGTEPTETSAIMEKEVTLSGPADVKLRPFSHRSKYDKVTVGSFKEGNYLKANPKPKKAKPGGLSYSYYEGVWDSLPDFNSLKPVQAGVTDKDFNVNKLPLKTNFACLIEGHLEIQKEGYYIFVLDSDDGSKLYIGDQLLINHNGLHGMGDGKSFILPLQKGFYPIRLEYFQKSGSGGLELIYLVSESPEPDPTPIPFELQYSVKK